MIRVRILVRAQTAATQCRQADMPYRDPAKQKAFLQQHYLNNKADYRRRSVEGKARRQQLLTDAKDRPCMDCGESYPSYVMDLDHREGVTKIDKLSDMVSRYSVQAILDEISKCDAVCANCHRERTFQRLRSSVDRATPS